MYTPNRRTSMLMAGAIALAVVVWLLSGLGRDPADRIGQLADGAAQAEVLQVRVEQRRASEMEREIVVSARTEPDRVVQLRAETDGVVVALHVERGSEVEGAARIISLDRRDRDARLREAEALVQQRELEYQATENLSQRQFVSEVQIAEALTRLESAKAAREAIMLDLKRTEIIAPFDGVLQDRSVEIGDYVRSGDAVAELVDIDPLIIAGDISGREVTELRIGGPGKAVLVDGTELEGRIRYLAPVADDSTRTFHVELAVDNPVGLRAGLTAELRLAGARILAHPISPALLSLSEDGTVGVKTVDQNSRVRFHPTEIAGSTDDGILVSGLPEVARLITVGQGFVTEGQIVEAALVPALDAGSGYERAD